MVSGTGMYVNKFDDNSARGYTVESGRVNDTID